MGDLTLASEAQQLASLLLEQQEIKALLERASRNEPLSDYQRDIVLHVDPHTRRITHANPQALTYLGYSLDELQALSMDELHISAHTDATTPVRYTESSQPILVYEGFFRHREGRILPSTVRQRTIGQGAKSLLHYALEDVSVCGLIVRELTRREDDRFQFREKLKLLNRLSNQLGQCTHLDELCRLGITLGIEHLGFDRLSLWFLNAERKQMEGSFGTDESGHIRDERGQSWNFEDSYVEDFLRGQHDPIVTEDTAPIYNHRSEIIAYGWHISVPLVSGHEVIGFMGADNLIQQQALKSYQPELLRLYGASIGHLVANLRERETILQQELELQLEQERVRVLQTFVTDLGHEFKTPLSIIMTQTYLLEAISENEKNSERIRKINQNVQQLNNLLDDMLYTIQLERGQKFDFHQVNLNSLVMEAIQTLHPQAQAKQQNLHYRFPSPTPILLKADSQHLNNAIQELIQNAILYTPQHGQVGVTLQQTDDLITMIIEDSGIGIAPEHLPKVFDHFFRVDSARSTRGTGLGLTIVKHIMAAHQGNIEITSQPEHGTQVRVTFKVT